MAIDETDADALATYIAAAEEMLGLTIAPEWRASVQENLKTTLAHARNVQSFSLPDEAEPAFVFEA